MSLCGKDIWYLDERCYLVHVASRSNLMTTFCRLEEVDQLGIDVNLGMLTVISRTTKTLLRIMENPHLSWPSQ